MQIIITKLFTLLVLGAFVTYALSLVEQVDLADRQLFKLWDLLAPATAAFEIFLALQEKVSLRILDTINMTVLSSIVVGFADSLVGPDCKYFRAAITALRIAISAGAIALYASRRARRRMSPAATLAAATAAVYIAAALVGAFATPKLTSYPGTGREKGYQLEQTLLTGGTALQLVSLVLLHQQVVGEGALF